MLHLICHWNRELKLHVKTSIDASNVKKCHPVQPWKKKILLLVLFLMPHWDEGHAGIPGFNATTVSNKTE